MKKFYLFLTAIVFSTKIFALEGKINTSITLSPTFKYLSSDKEKNISERNFVYDKLSYDYKLLDLNLSDRDIGIDFNLALKSMRSDIKLNDWDNDIKNEFNREKRTKNHDFMGLLKFKYLSPTFFGLKNETILKYYIDNFDSIRSRDKKTNDVVELGREAEYINEDGTKDASGNIYFDTSLKGKISNTEIDTNISYKANQFDRFNVDESYLKTKLNIKSEVFKNNKIEFNHKFDYDLYFSTRLFDPFNPGLDEFPDFMGGNYVTKFDNYLDFDYHYLYSKNNKDKIGIKVSNNIASLLVAGEHYSNPYTTKYNVHKPILNIYLEKEVYKNLSVSPMIINEFEVRDTKFLKQDDDATSDREIWASYKPKIKLKTKYMHLFKENENRKIDYTNEIGYKQDMTLSPFITEFRRIKHTLFTLNNLELKYDINDKNKFNFNLKSNISMPIQDKNIKPISSDLEYDLNFENTDYTNLKLKANINGKFKVVSLFKTLNPETLSNKFQISFNSDYLIFEKNKEKLNILNELKYINNSSFNYYLKEENKSKPTYTEEEANEGFYKGNLKYVYGSGTLKAVEILNSFILNTNLKYENQLNEKLKLSSNLKIDSKLDLLKIRLEKKYTYKDKIPEDKVDIEVFDDFNNRINVGGSIVIMPNLELDYKVRENIKLNSKFSSDIIFERKVVDKVIDEKRIDNGAYNYIDKEFRFRKFVPKINLNLEYNW